MAEMKANFPLLTLCSVEIRAAFVWEGYYGLHFTHATLWKQLNRTFSLSIFEHTHRYFLVEIDTDALRGLSGHIIRILLG